MSTFTRISRQLLLPMALFLPFWLTIGRGLLGSAGWYTLIYLFSVAPALIICLVALRLLLGPAKEGAGTGAHGLVQSLLLSTFYVATILHGFFLVDFGDAPNSESSLALNVFGKSFEETALTLAWLCFLIGLLALVAAFAVAIYQRLRRK